MEREIKKGGERRGVVGIIGVVGIVGVGKG